ncbi:MAG: glycoside hydrolase family 25 protein [Acetobacteraceae bacterium]
MPTSRTVIDLSHHNSVSSWQTVKAAGIIAVVHKATEGVTFQDQQYHVRREAAKAQNLLWGSYHFSSGDDPLQQVENYLTFAAPQADELMCIDFEPSSSGPNMSLDQLVEFVGLIHKEKGRSPVIYGGSMLRDATKGVTSSPISACPLWYARYAASPFGVPALWSTLTLWQYTDGNAGNPPHDVAGIGFCDRDIYFGSDDDLHKNWPLT